MSAAPEKAPSVNYDEAVAATIQDACDNALREQKFGVAAIYVLRALKREGLTIVRDDTR